MRWFLSILLGSIFLASGASSYYQFNQIRTLSSEVASLKDTIHLSNSNREQSLESTEVNECNSQCKEEIEKQIADAIAKLTITPILQSRNTTSPIATKQVSYAGLGSGSTMSTDWVTLEESTIVLDLENDYSKTATVSWEASLKVAYGNGTAFARLYDATHNIAVDGSEFKTENNQSFVQVTSKDLPFWKGRNTYKVQIKSLNGFEVTMSGARLKIQY